MSKVGECIQLAGSPAAGVLLYRIRFWDQQHKIRRGSSWWIVNSREQWAEDTGLTLAQVKHGMAALRNRGFILTEEHLFKSKTHAFVRLASGANAQPVGQPETNGSGETAPTNKNGVLKGSPEMESGEAVLTDDSTNPASGEEDSDSAEEDDMIKVSSVKDVEAAVKAQAILHKPNKVHTLELIWTAMTVKPGCFSSPMKVSERGQLGLFIKACPAGKAPEVLRYVLGHWIAFGKEAGDYGALNPPKEPVVGVLLKYAPAAVKLWGTSRVKPASAPKANSMQSAATGTTLASKWAKINGAKP